ncbi:hypothetical protein E2C01_057888 [Portunus trituberculatus]|uniref:Uncharacterized protein n=1 Tax=Portunus trituberculatus TaxID=210409 RepID=A0A5B7H2B7_PORTR|nr:hypothetical protein [Portunus trituberculatus]
MPGLRCRTERMPAHRCVGREWNVGVERSVGVGRKERHRGSGRGNALLWRRRLGGGGGTEWRGRTLMDGLVCCPRRRLADPVTRYTREEEKTYH